MIHLKSIAAASAAVSMLATPLAAADLPVSSQRSAYAAPAYDAEQDKAERHRRYRGWRHGYRHRNRVDAGDVIAGIAIIGGIAAIASAANRNKRDRYDDRRYRYRNSSYNSNNIDRAVDACLREIERDVRVEGVDNVGRAGDGWQVSGRLYNGDNFTCAVGRNGRIDRIDYGGGAFSGAAVSPDGQWSDDAYAEARLNYGLGDPRAAVPTSPSGPQPAYPGGPIEGNLGG
ncbi:hypothetical protein [Erythrobacter litoralis]|uniref:Secreted protein n=1 Tax=Erythrobacter litoralis (strain HTCC2594) TaxID=314225 RepID=Q2N9E1_ERYLH|nr:hypothetical protein [Erythrobacter litoralis]ABC63700.1 hypothetical protein ELI_08040 [Erythrobacter litoralis HTCC2594]